MPGASVYCGEELVARLDWIPERGDIIETTVHSASGQKIRRFKVLRKEHRAIGADDTPKGMSVLVTACDVTGHGDRLIPVRGSGWTWKLDRKVARMVLAWIRDTPPDSRDTMAGSLSLDILRAVQEALDRNG